METFFLLKRVTTLTITLGGVNPFNPQL
jgi:hypothetical protein